MTEQSPKRKDRDDPEILYCPHCGHDGTFDGQGQETRAYIRTHSGGERKRVQEYTTRHRCTACGGEFVTIDKKSVSDPVELPE